MISLKDILECFTQSQHFWDILKIVLAFTLTTVIGAWLTSRFQKNNWEYQNKSFKEERYKDKATKIFEDISSILDQRLFRYRQIVYAFRTNDDEKINKSFDEYRVVLFKWNDHINRNYAMVEKFFGKKMRETLEYKINKDMIFIGTLLERIKKGTNGDVSAEDVWRKIDILNAKVYRFDISMLQEISNKGDNTI